ncbi:MAG: hypothetical protein V3U85_04665 [Hyphomicrobium sp.]
MIGILCLGSIAGLVMGSLKSISVDEIMKRGSIKDVDVLRFRAAFYHDDVISAEEAEALFAMNDACSVQDPSWVDFFIEAVTDHIIDQTEPEGYLTAENAEWLIAHITRDGKVKRKTEVDLLVNVLEKARWSPVSLVRFALEQVKAAVIEGEGPFRPDQSPPKGQISESEVELVRRMLYAFGGDGNVAVTRAEAEVLFDINDATADAEPNPAWTDLFVKAVANVVMAASGQMVPTREEALRRERWLADRGELSPGAMLSAMVTTSLDAVRGAYHDQSPEERALARLEHQRIEIITNEVITAAEAEWLCERIGRDGRLTPNETALVAYLKKESPNIHPELQATVDRLSQAA